MSEQQIRDFKAQLVRNLRDMADSFEAELTEERAGHSQEGAGWRYFVRKDGGSLFRLPVGGGTDQQWCDSRWMPADYDAEMYARYGSNYDELTEREAVKRFGPAILDGEGDDHDRPADAEIATDSAETPVYGGDHDTPDTPTPDKPKTLADVEPYVLCELDYSGPRGPYCAWKDSSNNVFMCGGHKVSGAWLNCEAFSLSESVARVLGPVHITAKEQSDE